MNLDVYFLDSMPPSKIEMYERMTSESVNDESSNIVVGYPLLTPGSLIEARNSYGLDDYGHQWYKFLRQALVGF